MRYATERDWDDATRGNATADREVFERWALSIPGAPRRSDPRVWSYLIMMADEMAALERGAYGQDVPGIENSVAAGVVANFQEEPAYEANSDDADYQITNAKYAKGMMKLRVPPSSDGFRGRAGRLGHAIARGRYSNREHGYIISKAAAAKFEKLYAEGWDANTWSGELEPPVLEHEPNRTPAHRPNGRLPTWWGDMTDTYRQGVRGVHGVLTGRPVDEEPLTPQRAREIIEDEMMFREGATDEEREYVQHVADQRGLSWHDALWWIARDGVELEVESPRAGPREAPTRSLRARPQRKVLR